MNPPRQSSRWARKKARCAQVVEQALLRMLWSLRLIEHVRLLPIFKGNVRHHQNHPAVLSKKHRPAGMSRIPECQDPGSVTDDLALHSCSSLSCRSSRRRPGKAVEQSLGWHVHHTDSLSSEICATMAASDHRLSARLLHPSPSTRRGSNTILHPLLHLYNRSHKQKGVY